jgi:prevent-host-death family protein
MGRSELMKKQVIIAEAKNGLPGIVHRAGRGQPVEIMRRGRPVAVTVSINDYNRMQASESGF